MEYIYDGHGRRTSQRVQAAGAASPQTTHFLYHGQDVLLELEDGVLARRTLHGPAVDQILAVDSGAGSTGQARVLWHLSDHLGTPRDLVDHGGAVVNHRVFDAFGNLTSQTSNDPAVSTRYSFTGREYDAATGLHHYRARY